MRRERIATLRNLSRPAGAEAAAGVRTALTPRQRTLRTRRAPACIRLAQRRTRRSNVSTYPRKMFVLALLKTAARADEPIEREMARLRIVKDDTCNHDSRDV